MPTDEWGDEYYEDEIDLDEYLPEGFSTDNLTEREMELVEFFLEEKWEELDDQIEEVEEAIAEMHGTSAAYITPDHEICVPFHTLRRLNYEPGDTFETEMDNGNLTIRLIKKPWAAPDWLKEE